MSQSRTDRKFTQIIDRLEEQPGTDLNRDLLKVALTAVDIAQVDQNIAQIGGEAQSAVDVANQIDRIEAALASTGGDQLRVDLQNNNAGNLPFTLEANNAGTLAVEQQSPVVIEVSDDAGNTASIQAEELGTALGGTETAIITYVAQALAAIGNDQLRVDLQNNNAGTLPTEQQTPIGIEDSTGTQVDPLDTGDQPLDVSDATVPVAVQDPDAAEAQISNQLANSADISAGVSQSITRESFSVYIKNDGANSTTITLAYSPDGGTTFFDDPDGTIDVPASASTIVEVGYEATDVELSANNTEPCTVFVVER